MLRWFGCEVGEETIAGDGRNSVNGGAAAASQAKRLSVSGDGVLTAKDLVVPGDVSSAAFFLSAGASLRGSALVLENVGLNPSRIAVIDALKRFGANIAIRNERTAGNEPVGDILVTGGIERRPGRENALRGEIIANLIDEIPILAVFGTQLEGGLEIRDARELRVKESDRIASVVTNLKAMGAEVEEFEDGLRVERSDLKGTTIDSFGDHRIAMAFAVAGLLAQGETEIKGAGCAAVSYPHFFEDLESVCQL